MEHINAMITFSHRCNYYDELIQNYPVRSVNANNIENNLCLQSLVSVVKFIPKRGLALRDDENVGSPRKFFQKIFKTVVKQILQDAMLLATGFAVSQIANHCQIPCCVITFCYT